MPVSASTSHNPARPPGRGRRPMLTLLIAVLLLGGLGFIATIPLEHGAARIIRSALAPHFTVERIELRAPNRLDLYGVNGPGAQIGSVQIFLDPVTLLTRGVLPAVRRVELVEPSLAVESGLSPLSNLPFPPSAALPGGLNVASSSGPVSGLVAVVRGGRARVGGVEIEFDAELRPEGAEWIVTGAATIAPAGAAPEAAAAGGAFTVRGVWQPSTGFVRADARARDLLTPYGTLAEAKAALTCERWGDECRIEFEGRDGRLLHHALNVIRGRVEQDLVGWRLADAEGEGSDGARYTAGGYLYRNRAPRVDVAIEATGVPLVEAAAWTGVPALQAAAESGAVDAVVRVEGDAASLTAAGEVRIGRSTWAGVAASEGDVRFRLSEGRIEADAKLSLLAGGALAAEIRERGQGRRAAIRFEDLPVPAVVQAARAMGYAPWPHALAAAGRVSGLLTVDFGADRPAALTLTLESDRFTYRGAPLAPLRAAGSWSPDGWRIDELVLLGEQGGPTFVAGSGSGRTVHDFTAELHWRGVSPDRLASVFGDILARFRGDSSGSLRLAAGAEGLTAEGELEGQLIVEDVPFDLRAVVRAPANAPLEAEGSVSAQGGRLDFAGDWAPGAAAGSLTARLAAFPAPALAALGGLPGLTGTVSGQVQIGADSRGWEAAAHLESPRLGYGGYALADAELSVALGAEPPAEAVETDSSAACRGCLWGEVVLRGAPGEGDRFAAPVEWSAVFRGREAELLPTAFPLAGGRLQLAGTARLEPGQGWRVALESAGEGLWYRQAGVALDLDYRAALTGPALRPLLGGRVRVRRGEVDLLNLPRMGRGGRGGASERTGIDLDVTVAVEGVRLVARSLLDAEIAGELQVKGSSRAPQVYGEVGARRGSFRYGQTLFTLERAAATFSGSPLAPRLDVAGTGQIGNEAVRVEVSGPVGALALSVAGPDGESRTLGEGGALAAVSAGQWGEVGRQLVQWFGGELLQDAYWQLGRTLGDALDLDRFRIEADPATGGIALYLGKYVSDGLYLSYRRTLARSGNSEVGLEYTLTPGVRVHSRWDGPGGARLGAEARIPF